MHRGNKKLRFLLRSLRINKINKIPRCYHEHFKSKCTTCNSLVRMLRAHRSLSASDLRARESCFTRIAYFSSLAAYIAKSFRAIWISEKNCRDRPTNLDMRGRYRSYFSPSLSSWFFFPPLVPSKRIYR